MRYALTAEQTRAAEGAAVASGAVSLSDLMDRAGAHIADEAGRLGPPGPVCVVCGGGNNGGDGWVAARLLKERGRPVEVVTLVDPEALDGEARGAFDRAAEAGVPWHLMSSSLDLAQRLANAAVAIDAVFGFGFRGAPREPHASAIEAIDDADAFVVSADVPSGVDADTGAVPGAVVHADVTVTFSAPKAGLLHYPGARCAGEIIVADVGLPRALLDAEGALELWDRGDYRDIFPYPAGDDHKGSRGRVLVVAGSSAYAGAAVLACAGAARMGAGYVMAAVPASVAPVVNAALPHIIARALPAASDGSLDVASLDPLLELAADADAIVVGPGLTTAPGAVRVVRALVEAYRGPLVVDADALNALASDGRELLLAREAPTLLTPHPGELARLLGSGVEEVQADRVAAARRLTGRSRAVLLKGAHTVVAGGSRTAITLAGNPGLASAGTGDVLAGMLGTLLAQGLAPYDAGVLGAYLHSRAADLAVVELTETCLVATDLPAYLPKAVGELTRG